MQNSIKNRRKRKKHRFKINQKSPQKQEASTQNRRQIGCGKKYGWHYIQFWFARGARSMHQTVSYIMSYIIIYQISYIISIICHIISYHISYISYMRFSAWSYRIPYHMKTYDIGGKRPRRTIFTKKTIINQSTCKIQSKIAAKGRSI